MSRIINPDTGVKQRRCLSILILHTCWQFFVKKKKTDEILDMSAFIYYTLKTIDESIESTVLAWERKGFWIKADKFRMEWSWASKNLEIMDKALKSNDIAQMIQLISDLQIRLLSMGYSPRNKLAEPWIGSWNRYNKKS